MSLLSAGGTVVPDLREVSSGTGTSIGALALEDWDATALPCYPDIPPPLMSRSAWIPWWFRKPGANPTTASCQRTAVIPVAELTQDDDMGKGPAAEVLPRAAVTSTAHRSAATTVRCHSQHPPAVPATLEP